MTFSIVSLSYQESSSPENRLLLAVSTLCSVCYLRARFTAITDWNAAPLYFSVTFSKAMIRVLPIISVLFAGALAQTLTGDFTCMTAGNFQLCQNLWGASTYNDAAIYLSRGC